MGPERDTIRISCRVLWGQLPNEFLVRIRAHGVQGEREIDVLADRRYIVFEAGEPTDETPEVGGYVIAWRLGSSPPQTESGLCESSVTVGLPGEPWGPGSKTVVTVPVPA